LLIQVVADLRIVSANHGETLPGDVVIQASRGGLAVAAINLYNHAVESGTDPQELIEGIWSLPAVITVQDPSRASVD